MSTIALILSAPLFVLAEQIDSFATTLTVHTDRSVEVVETIRYDFGEAEKHGIYRDIPSVYVDASGNKQSVKIDGIAVRDGKMSPVPFESFKNGDTQRLKIGDPDILVTGKKTYEISYVAHDVIGFFPDHDEIYWNVTGNDWLFDIQHVSARVYAPASTTQHSCYVGPRGSTFPCETQQVIAGDGSALFFEAKYALGMNEGMTVAVGWQKGVVLPPTPPSRSYQLLATYGWMPVPFVVFILMYSRWNKSGRDEKGRGAIIPEYDAPQGVSPALMYEILNEGMHSSVVSALIIELAVKGYLKIRREEERTLGVFKSVSYRFEKLKPSDTGLSLELLPVFNALFKNRDSVADDELKKDGEMVTAFAALSSVVSAKAIAEGYFRSDPKAVRVMYICFAVILAVTAFIVAIKFESVWAFIAIMLSAIIVAFIGYHMPAKTKKGALVKEHILGLKDYLQIAEKNRLDFHHAPERSPELFEKLLPYAMVLGVSAAWAKEFEGMQRAAPK